MRHKVLILDNSKSMTGAYRSIYVAATRLSSDFEFHFAISDQSELDSILEKDQYRYLKLGYLEIDKSVNILRYPFRLRKNRCILRNYINENNISIIHVNDMYNMLGVHLKRQNNGIIVIQHVRLLRNSYIAPLYRVFAKKLIDHVDKIIAVSKAAQRDFPRTDKLVQIYNPMTSQETYPEYAPVKRPYLDLLGVGQLMPGKGQEHILLAIGIIVEQGFKVKIRLAGKYNHTDKYFHRLKDYVNKNKLNDVVEFLGHVDDMEALYKSTDVVINFSESESFSRVCLEAHGYGLPVISSDCGGPREIIEDGITGFIVPNRSAKDLANAILWINDIEIRKKMSFSARSLIRSRFSDVQTTEKLKSLYLELLEERG